MASKPRHVHLFVVIGNVRAAPRHVTRTGQRRRTCRLGRIPRRGGSAGGFRETRCGIHRRPPRDAGPGGARAGATSGTIDSAVGVEHAHRADRPGGLGEHDLQRTLQPGTPVRLTGPPRPRSRRLEHRDLGFRRGELRHRAAPLAPARYAHAAESRFQPAAPPRAPPGGDTGSLWYLDSILADLPLPGASRLSRPQPATGGRDLRSGIPLPDKVGLVIFSKDLDRLGAVSIPLQKSRTGEK